MTENFTDWLCSRSEPDWTAVVEHPFTDALFDGSMPDEYMSSYLVQDYQFVDDFLALLGAAVAKADRYTSRLALAGSIAVVTSEENTYFQRSFDALGIGEIDRVDPELDPATVAFRDLMRDTKDNGGYAEILTVLTVAEWSDAIQEMTLGDEWLTIVHGSQEPSTTTFETPGLRYRSPRNTCLMA